MGVLSCREEGRNVRRVWGSRQERLSGLLAFLNTGLTAQTGQQAVPRTHLPGVCPLLAAGPPPRRVCFLDCSQTTLEKGIRSCLPSKLSLAAQTHPIWL